MAWQVIGGLLTLIHDVRAQYGNMTVGTIGDAAHRTEVSDHNPDANGNVCAADFMIGPEFSSFDAAQLVTELVTGHDTRLHYVIYNHRIYTSEHGFASQTYSGVDPHTNHVHVSVNHNAYSTGEWDLMASLSDDDIQRIVNALCTPKPIIDADGKQNGVETAIGKAVMNTTLPMGVGKPRGYVWTLLAQLFDAK